MLIPVFTSARLSIQSTPNFNRSISDVGKHCRSSHVLTRQSHTMMHLNSSDIKVNAKGLISRKYSSDSYLEHPTETEKRITTGDAIQEPITEGDIDIATPRVVKIVDEILTLSFIEAAQLSKLLSKRLGISSAPFTTLAGAQPVPQAAQDPLKAEEPKKKAKVDVKLIKFPDTAKFKVLKEVRNLKPGMNLMESKSLIEGLPKIVMENISTTEGEQWKKALTDAGAEVELV